MQKLQQLWEQAMTEAGIFEDIVTSFDSVGESL